MGWDGGQLVGSRLLSPAERHLEFGGRRTCAIGSERIVDDV